MAIYLGVPPERDFDRIPRDYSRDPKISGMAKAVLYYLLGHRDGYRLTVKQMTAEFKEGEDAIYAAIKELIGAGYVRRERRRGQLGRVGTVDYLVIGADGEFPQVDTTSGISRSGEAGSGPTCDDAEFSQVDTTSGFTRSGCTTSGGSGTKKNKDKKTTKLGDQDQRNEVNWRTADASREQEDDLPLAFDGHQPRRVFEDWPAQDWDLFRSHIGADHIHSDGSRWAEGTHTTRALYLGFRQRGQNPVRWPGRYLDETSSTNGVEYFLDDQGITPAEPEETP